MAESASAFGARPGEPTTPYVSPSVQTLEVWLCWDCGNYQPLTSADYEGGLTGSCSVCKKMCREVHRFTARLDIGGLQCGCWSGHERRTAA